MGTELLPLTFTEGFHDNDVCKRMQYCLLGKTGLQVSKISFGCGTLSSFYGDLDVAEAVATVHKALKQGINYFDTAPYYGCGRSEEVLGLALKQAPRSAYYVATKVGRYEQNYQRMFDFSARKTRESVEKSLKLLGLDYIDVIQIHDIEFAEDLNLVLNECLPELESLVGEGKVKYIGVTGYPLEKLKECITKAPNRFDVVLSYARNTLMDNSLQHYLDFFRSQNLGIICASGHALGLLTNHGPQPWHPATNQQKQLCQQAAELCRNEGVELGKLAMHHFLQMSGPATYLTGMQTRHLLDSNLNTFYQGLLPKEHQLLQTLKQTIFTKAWNWEGIELQNYRNAIRQLQN